jgi:hypothetical protein
MLNKDDLRMIGLGGVTMLNTIYLIRMKVMWFFILIFQVCLLTNPKGLLEFKKHCHDLPFLAK